MRFPTMSVRSRVLALALVALTPSLAMLGVAATQTRNERYRDIHRAAARLGQYGALEMQRVVGGAQDLLTALAAAEAVRGFEPVACAAYLSEVTRVSPQFAAIAAVDDRGAVRCADRASEARGDAPAGPHVRAAMERGAFVVGLYQPPTADGRGASLPLAAPIRDPDGAVIGALVGALDLGWLNRIVEQRSFAQNDSLTVADAEGVIIARKPQADRFVGTRIPDRFLPLVTAPAPGTIEITSQDGTRRIIGYQPAGLEPRGLYISAGVAVDEAMAPVEANFRRSLGIVAAGAVASIAAATALGRALIKRPIDQIRATVAGWRQGDDQARTGMPDGRNEILALGSDIDRFMDELADSRQARREAEAAREMLGRELQHRVKNLLATVQGLAARTFAGATDPQDALRKLRDRIAALAVSHEALMENRWDSAPLATIAARVIEPFGREQFRIEGPSLNVGERAAFALSMTLHELCTNASKYGALSAPGGCVDIEWALGGETFTLRWVERGGPAVAPPSREGFGSTLIQRLLRVDLRGSARSDYDATGVAVTLTAPASAVLAKGLVAAA
jgi:two-component sensor histidine kinase